MTIRIQRVHHKPGPEILEEVRKKIRKLEKFSNRIVRADVFLKKDNADPVKDHVCEVRLLIKGNDLFTTSRAETYEQAAQKATESLKRKLNKNKTTRISKRNIKD